MYTVSSAFRSNIGAPSRRSKAFIEVQLDDITLPASTVTASSTHADSTLESITYGRLSEADFHCIGVDTPDEVRNPHVGWISTHVSSSDSRFLVPETLTIEYASPVESVNFYIAFPKLEPAQEFEYKMYDASGNVICQAEILHNEKILWGIKRCNEIPVKRIVISIHKTKFPFSNAKIVSAGIVGKIFLGDGDFSDFTLLEEKTSDDAAPFGGVSANELSFNIFNPQFAFSPTNLTGPFGGLIMPGIPIRAFAGIEVSTSVYELVPLGIYEVAEWSAPSSSLEAQITAYDGMYAIQSEDVPMLRLEQNATVGQLLFALFRALGVASDDIVIDESINEVIPFAYIPWGTVGDALNKLSMAGFCHISVDRKGKFIARRRVANFTANVPRWTDEDQIMDVNVPERFDTLYSRLVVKVNLPSLHRNSSLLEMTDVPSPPGSTTFSNLTFSMPPVVQLEALTCANGVATRIADLSYGSHTMTYQIANPSQANETVQINAAGVYCQFITQEHTYLTGAKGRQVMSIDNELVQTKAHADAIASQTIPFLSDPFNRFDIAARGDLSLETGDVIGIVALTQNVPLTYVELTRIETKYDGGFDTQIVGRKVYA